MVQLLDSLNNYFINVFELSFSSLDIFILIKDGKINELENLILESNVNNQNPAAIININQNRWSGWSPLHRAAELVNLQLILV